MRLLLTILLVGATLSLGCGPKKKPPPMYMGKPVRHWAIQAQSEDPVKRREAAVALGKCGPAGLEALIPLLQDQDHRTRAAAILGITGMGATAVPKLKELVHDADTKAGRTAAAKALTQALVNMGRDGLKPLIELLNDRSPTVRFYAAKSFTLVDRNIVGAAIPALKKRANSDPNPSVRRAASMTLALLQPPAPKFRIPGPGANE